MLYIWQVTCWKSLKQIPGLASIQVKIIAWKLITTLNFDQTFLVLWYYVALGGTCDRKIGQFLQSKLIWDSQKCCEVDLIAPIVQLKEWRLSVFKENVCGHSTSELGAGQGFYRPPRAKFFLFSSLSKHISSPANLNNTGFILNNINK